MEYFSEVSKRTEHLPIVVSLLGAPGADMKLLDAARRTLERSGRTSVVATGSKMGIGSRYIKGSVWSRGGIGCGMRCRERDRTPRE
jgi:hypothetical protein